MEETQPDKPTQTKQSTGTGILLLGGGFGAYGTTLALTTGFVCPVCLVVTPLLLGTGAVLKYKHLKSKNITKS